MKQHHLLRKFISLLLALALICAVGAAAAFAEPAEEQAQPQDNPAQENPVDSQPQETPQSNPEQQNEQEQQPEQQPEQPQEEQQDGWYDYIYQYDEDAVSSYVEPEHLGDLPAVSESQVVEATAVAMPNVAVSDASLFSGIVMWLCVALGIAVVVGVLVSKRTKRRG